MKSKVVFSMLALLLLLGISYVYAYHTTASTFRTQWTEAQAESDNSGLSNGTYNAYAMVSSGSVNAGSFGNNSITAAVSDKGTTSSSATANAAVGGYDSNDNYQSSSASSYLEGN